jgi:hypothetical protein
MATVNVAQVISSLLFFLILLKLVGCVNSSSHEKRNSSLVFEQDSLDVGILHAGDTVMGNFYFHNTADFSVQIAEVNSSCGCLLPDMDFVGRDIKPGEQGKISLILRTSKGVSGVFRETIAIRMSQAPYLKVLSVKVKVKERL